MVNELNNPLVENLVNTLRNIDTDALRFRHIVKEITKFLLYEAMKDGKLINKTISTFRDEAEYNVLNVGNMSVVTVLRAGMPMLESIMETLPDIEAGFLAMKRDEETHQAKLYYDRVDECNAKTVLLVDVMLATGSSLIDAIKVIQKKNPDRIVCLNVIASPEGIKSVQDAYSEVDMYIATIDRGLDENKFILPGLGDAGDREYNTP